MYERQLKKGPGLCGVRREACKGPNSCSHLDAVYVRERGEMYVFHVLMRCELCYTTGWIRQVSRNYSGQILEAIRRWMGLGSVGCWPDCSSSTASARRCVLYVV